MQPLEYIYGSTEKWCKGLVGKYYNTFNEDNSDNMNDGYNVTSNIEMEYQEATTTGRCIQFWFLTLELHFFDDAGSGISKLAKFEADIKKFEAAYDKDPQNSFKITKLDGIEDFTNEGRLHIVYSYSCTYSL